MENIEDKLDKSQDVEYTTTLGQDATSTDEGNNNDAMDGDSEPSVEEQAGRIGWKPGGKLSAEEFLDRQSFFDKIREQKRIITNQNKDIKVLAGELNAIKAFMYEQNLEYERNLKSQYEEIIETETDDIVRVKQAQKALIASEKKIQKLEEASKPAQTQVETPIEYQEFIEDNPDIFELNTPEANALQAYALKEEQRIREGNPNYSPKQIIDTLRKSVDSFRNPRKKTQIIKPSADQGVTRNTKGEGKLTVNDLSAADRDIYNVMVTKNKMISEQGFLKSVAGKYKKD